ncbi:hypothetical protein [Bradyrhizobium sp. S3.2.12]|uniref:hypothetical protein n=1 Tax=Bradyrhizobium sp. S3.2.12 TaxID=3156387 RepID=UPI003394F954
MRTNGTRVSVVGSFIGATLPDDIDSFIHDGICVDPRNNTPMEMDAYSLYLGLRALEQTQGTSFSEQRTRLAKAVLRRMSDCDGFWSHGAWTGSPREIHMRFTAAAVRLLTEAQLDGLDVPTSLILDALKRHLTFAEPLSSGTWFLHDSLEAAETRISHPHLVRSNNAFGSTPLNCLVLNTHADTLLTITYVLAHAKDIGVDDRLSLTSSLTSGIAALKLVLHTPQGIVRRCFTAIDSFVRAGLFQTYASRSSLNRAVKKLILRLYFPLRQRFRSWLPTFVFTDGYTERDISLPGTSFEYHLVNLYDLSRLLAQLKRSDLVRDAKFVETCEAIVDRGLDYAIRGPYWNYLIAATEENTRSIILCETIIGRLDARDDQPVPDHWIEGYCRIRRRLPPTPALAGYDPALVQPAAQRELKSSNLDIILLSSGKRLEIDYIAETFRIEPLASRKAKTS